MRRLFVFGAIMIFVFIASSAWAQKEVKLFIATGSTGGIYYPIGRGVADILSKYIPYADIKAEETKGIVNNCLMVNTGKADLALVMVDIGWDAYQGTGRFREKIPLRTMAVLYPNNMHIVTLGGLSIEKVTDLKGKRVSTGALGSGTEAKSLRILEAYGLNPNKDIVRDRLGPSESAGALKDRKIDAYFWDGGLPTASVTDLGATPGIKIKLIGHEDAIPKMREKYGPIYIKGIIPAKTYPGQDVDVPISVVWNLLVCNENMREDLVYEVVKILFDHKSELVSVHREARWLSLEPQVGGSPFPFHPGAIRYFTEKGLDLK
ncbi:MAG: C4-dicarboxylate ABC transporter substrate-binding protein [Deltaproteobacteria bacterium CG_4_8_14_3_um_filter_45_9]|nr:MAG: C4-dicarboxylate ABC transporter substrate-binding protein [Deltaproteobacteria bacterium CG03_land_8_20_14_0_80_45_14]PIX23408.1 MAG: C4-dicarboxylate ABC transporter substrate-binding protein [Deltaproteobacteria bacterium CG_4_8_14_3_um_filter_45_9]